MCIMVVTAIEGEEETSTRKQNSIKFSCNRKLLKLHIERTHYVPVKIDL